MFHYHGEEKECCLRLMEADYDIVFMPEPIVHAVDPTGRDLKRYLKTVIRNDCLGSLLKVPCTMTFVCVPIRIMMYFRLRQPATVAVLDGLLVVFSAQVALI